MASHHHCHHQQQPSCHHCCYYTCSCTASPSPCPSYSSLAPPQPQPSMSDPLLQAITAQLLQSSQTHHLYPQFLKPQQPQHQHHQEQQNHHRFQQQQQQQQRNQQQLHLITSLLQRIDALEASLRHLSPLSSSSFPASASFFNPSMSLRDLAARTIQTHFRAFLARRSRTLSYLKDLALIKSSLNALKSSLSLPGETQFKHYEAISQKAMVLLHQLDSIQGTDPMIREGKRSISRELVRFLEVVDRASVRRRAEQQVASSKVAIKKNVSFVEPVKKSRVFVRTHEPFSSGDVFEVDGDEDQIELIENLCKRVEDIGGELARVSKVDEEGEVVNERSDVQVSNGERNVGNNVKASRMNCETNGGHFGFSAPLPVQMEPKGR